MPSLSLAECLQTLALVSTHSHLCYIYVAVGSLHETQVLLAHALAVGSKLSDGTDGRCLGSLTAGVGVNLGVDDEDVDILTRTDDMVQTTVTDVVGSTVTTDDPLAALHEVVLQFLQLCAYGTTCSGTGINVGDEGSGSSLGSLSVILGLNPSLGSSLVLSTGLVAGQHLLQQGVDAGAHLLVGNGHTQTKLAEVLEERVGPSRTLTLGVLGVRCRGDRTRVDGRATRSVGYNLAVTEELRDELHVGSLTATGTST